MSNSCNVITMDLFKGYEQSIRSALSSGSDYREDLKKSNPEVMNMAVSFWNKGKICGQCQHFKPIKVGMNGSCSEVDKNTYTKPEEKACDNFSRKY